MLPNTSHWQTMISLNPMVFTYCPHHCFHLIIGLFWADSSVLGFTFFLHSKCMGNTNWVLFCKTPGPISQKRKNWQNVVLVTIPGVEMTRKTRKLVDAALHRYHRSRPLQEPEISLCYFHHLSFEVVARLIATSIYLSIQLNFISLSASGRKVRGSLPHKTNTIISAHSWPC